MITETASSVEAPKKKVKNKLDKKVKLTGVNIFMLVIMLVAVAIAVLFSVEYLRDNSSFSIDFNGGYTANLTYDGDLSKRDPVNMIEKRLDPLGSSNVMVEKTNSSNLLPSYQVSISRDAGYSQSSFNDNLGRRGYVYLLDQDGHDLLALQKSGDNWTARSKRLTSNGFFSSIVAGNNANTHRPQVEMNVNADQLADIKKSLGDKGQMFIYSDIGQLLNYMRNSINGLKELDQLINSDKVPIAQREALRALCANTTGAFSGNGEQILATATSQSNLLSQYLPLDYSDVLDNSKTSYIGIDWTYNDNRADQAHPLSFDPNVDTNIYSPDKPFDASDAKSSPMNAWLPHINDLVILSDLSHFFQTQIINYQYEPYVVGTVTDQASMTGSKIVIYNQNYASSEKISQITNLLNNGLSKNNFNLISYSVTAPTFGANVLKLLIIALGVLLILLMIYVVFYYRLLGVLALVMSLLFLMVTLVTFTYLNGVIAPESGVAIIVAFVLMLDSIIVLFTRFKDEYASGKTIRNAFKVANRKSFSAAFDINVGLFITSLTIFWFGTRAIKGFAMMMSLSLFAGFILGIIITRLILWLLSRHRALEAHPSWWGLYLENEKKPGAEFKAKAMALEKKAVTTLVKWVKPLVKPFIPGTKHNHQDATYDSGPIKVKKGFLGAGKWIMLGAMAVIMAGGIVSAAGGAKLGDGFDSRTEFIGYTPHDPTKTDYYQEIMDSYNKVETFLISHSDLNKYVESVTYSIIPPTIDDHQEGSYNIVIITSLTDNQKVSGFLNSLSGEASIAYLTWSPNGVTGVSGKSLFINLVIAISISFITLLVYIFIRFQWTYLLPILLNMLVSLGVLFGLCTIFQVTLSVASIGIFLAIMFISLAMILVIFDSIRELKIIHAKELVTKQEVGEILQKAVHYSWYRNGLMAGTILLGTILSMILAPSFWAVSLSFGLGIIASFIITYFMSGWIWTLCERWRIHRHEKRLKRIQKHFQGPDEYIIKGIND